MRELISLGMSAILFVIVLCLCLYILNTTTVISGIKDIDSVFNIQHIEAVDEMTSTPEEIYFYTDKGKYLFNGVDITFITDYPD